jgi:hypothetical protein
MMLPRSAVSSHVINGAINFIRGKNFGGWMGGDNRNEYRKCKCSEKLL